MSERQRTTSKSAIVINFHSARAVLSQLYFLLWKQPSPGYFGGLQNSVTLGQPLEHG
jgi:hypothetical protein